MRLVCYSIAAMLVAAESISKSAKLICRGCRHYLVPISMPQRRSGQRPPNLAPRRSIDEHVSMLVAPSGRFFLVASPAPGLARRWCCLVWCYLVVATRRIECAPTSQHTAIIQHLHGRCESAGRCIATKKLLSGIGAALRNAHCPACKALIYLARFAVHPLLCNTAISGAHRRNSRHVAARHNNPRDEEVMSCPRIWTA